MTLRRPVWALYALVVGLALHNFVMAMLWRAGVRGGALDGRSRRGRTCCSLVALALVVAERRALPFSRVDRAGRARARVRVRSSSSTRSSRSRCSAAARRTRGSRYALRHDLLIVGAYFLGRGLDAHRQGARAAVPMSCSRRPRSSRCFGLVDVYAVSLAWWRLSAGWFQHQLGLDYGPGLSHLPAELRLQRGRERRLPPAHLDVPLAARDRVPARRRDVLHPAPPALGARRSARCCSRRSSGRTRAPRVIALAAGLIVLALVRRRVQLARLGGGGRGRRVRVREGVRPLRAADALHRGGEGRAGAERLEDADRLARSDARRASRRRASTWRACATARRRC